MHVVKFVYDSHLGPVITDLIERWLHYTGNYNVLVLHTYVLVLLEPGWLAVLEKWYDMCQSACGLVKLVSKRT